MRASLATSPLLALVIASSAAGAQRWELGGKTGLSSVGVSTGEFRWTGASATSAAFFRGIMTDRLALVNEVMMNRRVGVSTLSTSTLTLDAQYVEVPVLLQARVGSVYGFAPFVLAGPSLVLRIRCRLRFSGGGFSTDDDCDSARYASNTLDYGINGGLGLTRNFGIVTLSAEGRYTLGIRQNVLPTGVPSAHAHGWTAFAGLSVPLVIPRSGPGTMLPTAPPVFSEPRAPERVAGRAETAVPAPVVAENIMERRITVDASDVAIRDLFDGISRETGVPIELSPDVAGRITIAFTSLPLARALATIVDQAGLAMSRSNDGGVWVVRIDRVPRATR